MGAAPGVIVLVLFCCTSLRGQDSLGHWETRAPLPTPRQEMPQAVLDGRIYLPGGLISGGFGWPTVEVYDPVSNSWEDRELLPQPLHHLGAASLNGKVYVFGGYFGDTFIPTNNVYEYDPLVDAWTERSPMPVARGAHIAVELGGKVYVIGGVQSGVGTVGRVDEYNPETDTWEQKSDMPTAREHLAGAAIDSLIYVIGGRIGPNLSTLEAYSPATDTWYTKSDMPTARGGLAAAALGGRLYVFGGEFPGVFEQNEEYDPMTDTWRTMAPMPTPRHGIGASTIGDSIFIIGGAEVAGFGVTDVNEAFVLPLVTDVTSSPYEIPSGFGLLQNFPNPFNPRTTIRFDIPPGSSGMTSLKIFDLLGREVATLLNTPLPPGSYSTSWDAAEFPSGVYVYRLVSGSIVLSRKLVLIK